MAAARLAPITIRTSRSAQLTAPIPSGGGAARIGERSNEQEQGDYRLVVRFGSSRPPTVRIFALDPGEGRVLRVASGTAAAQPVSAALFLAGNGAGAYRRVSALIPSPGAAP